MPSTPTTTEHRYPAFSRTPVRRAASFALRNEVGETFLRRKDPTADFECLIHDWKEALSARLPGSVAENQELLHLTDLVNASFILGHPNRDLDLILARKGVDRVYRDLIMEEGFWNHPVAFIDGVVEGLFRVGMIACRHALPDTPRLGRKVLLDRMIDDAPSLWLHIWINRTLITPHTRAEHQYPEEIEPGKKMYTDPMILLAIQYQQIYSAKYSSSNLQRNATLASFIPHVSLYLWASVSAANPDPDHDDYAHRPVVAILNEISDSTDDSSIRQGFLNEVIPAVGADALVLRWHQFLEGVQTGRFESGHFLEVGNLMQSLVRHRDIIHGFSRHNTFALSVQMCSGSRLPVSDRQTVWAALTGVSLLAGDTALENLTSSELIACISPEDYITHLTNGIYLADGRPAVFDMFEFLHEAIEWISTGIKDIGRTDGRRLFAKGYRERTRAVMHHEWWPALTRLRSLKQALSPNSQTDGLALALVKWFMFGDIMLGMNEDKERKHHEREAPRRCSHMACVYHRRVPEQVTGIQMKACRGCGEVRYCGRDCQLRDWKEGGHKTQCGRRLK